MLLTQSVHPLRVAIGSATPNDVNAIARFMCRLRVEPHDEGKDIGGLSSARAAARAFASDPGTVSVVAWDRDSARVVGHAVAVPAERDAIETAVAVARWYEDQGLRLLLLESVLRQAERRDFRFCENASERKPPRLDRFSAAGYALDRIAAEDPRITAQWLD